MLIFLIIFLLVVIATAILTTVSLIAYLRTRVPFVSLSTEKIQQIWQQVPLISGKTVVDLGCGDGRVLIAAHKRYGVLGIGYEINLWAYLRAKIRTWPYRQYIKIFYQNFLTADLSAADYVFTYLLPAAQEKVEAQVVPKLKAGSQLIAYAFFLPSLRVDQELNTTTDGKSGKIYVYKI